jgi:hypothetical protein
MRLNSVRIVCHAPTSVKELLAGFQIYPFTKQVFFSALAPSAAFMYSAAPKTGGCNFVHGRATTQQRTRRKYMLFIRPTILARVQVFIFL